MPRKRVDTSTHLPVSTKSSEVIDNNLSCASPSRKGDLDVSANAVWRTVNRRDYRDRLSYWHVEQPRRAKSRESTAPR